MNLGVKFLKLARQVPRLPAGGGFVSRRKMVSVHLGGGRRGRGAPRQGQGQGAGRHDGFV